MFLRFFAVALFAFSLTSPGRAVEKNGLSVTVNKTTLENNDTRGAGYYSDRINRTQGLKAVIRNMSFKEMPEGEVVWTILVIRWGTNTVVRFTGTEKLKGLKPAEATDMVIGKANMSGYKYYGSAEKDKTEWQVVVNQAGKEIIKAQSTPSFEGLAKRSIKGALPDAESE